MKEFLELGKKFRNTPIVDREFSTIRDKFDTELYRLSETLPKIVCLCGSTRFETEYKKANYDETMQGNIVLSVGCFQGEYGWGNAKPCVLDELHKRKIDLADEIFVLNVGGYIGDSTRSEIEYANCFGKTIRYLENPEFSPRMLSAHENGETHFNQEYAEAGL